MMKMLMLMLIVYKTGFRLCFFVFSHFVFKCQSFYQRNQSVGYGKLNFEIVGQICNSIDSIRKLIGTLVVLWVK